jgi:hypothetical protein
MNPADALAQIEQTQQKAFTEQRLPVWYFGGIAAVETAFQLGFDLDSKVLQVTVFLLSLLALGVLVGSLAGRSKIRWSWKSWSRGASAVFLGWLLANVALAIGAYHLFQNLDLTLPKALAGLVAIVTLTATTRPMENLVLRLSKGRVVR